MSRKIIFIDHDHRCSGSTVSLNYLMNTFLNNKYDVALLTPKSKEFTNDYSAKGIKVFRYDNRFIKTLQLDLHFDNKTSLFSFAGLVILFKNFIKIIYGMILIFNLIRKERPDVVYLNEYVVIQCAVVSYLMGLVTVTHIRSNFVKGTFGVRRSILKKLLVRFNDFVFAISKQDLKQVKEEHKKLKVIGEFLDEDNFKVVNNAAELKSKLGINTDSKIILFIGGISPMKGTLDVIKAVDILFKKQFNVYCYILGGIFKDDKIEMTNYYNACMNEIESSVYKNNFIILGEKKNPVEYISCCDVLVSANTESHFSRPIIEAWAQSKCVISYDLPHARDLVDNNINGILVRTGDIDALSDSIYNVLTDESLRTSLAHNGYQKAVTEFKAELNAEKIIEICNSAVKAKLGKE